MKKSKIIIALGIFIIITFFLCIDKNTYYKKQINFKSAEEVVEHLTSNILYVNTGEMEFSAFEETDALLECVSKRKRYTYTQVDCTEIKIIKERTLGEVGEEAIVDEYLRLAKNLKGYEISDKLKALSYEVEYKPLYDTIKIKGIMNLVLVDEGEGYVIDYFTLSGLEGGNNAKGK